MPVITRTRPDALQPPLKWAGGKRWQVPHIKSLWEPHAHRRLIEPFAGGLAVTLGVQPERALLNDANPHLINFYRWLKKGLRTSIAMENDEGLFYQHRDRFNALVRAGESDSRESAALFYYLNRTGYNGLCRFNSRGDFNVPFGSYKTITYARSFAAHREAFADWEFTTGDFAEIPLDRDDFVYADSAVRRGVHGLFAGRVLLGRSEEDGGAAGHAQRSGGAGQPVHAENRFDVPQARLRGALSRRAPADQLQWQPAPGQGNTRNSQPMTPRSVKPRASGTRKLADTSATMATVLVRWCTSAQTCAIATVWLAEKFSLSENRANN